MLRWTSYFFKRVGGATTRLGPSARLARLPHFEIRGFSVLGVLVSIARSPDLVRTFWTFSFYSRQCLLPVRNFFFEFVQFRSIEKKYITWFLIWYEIGRYINNYYCVCHAPVNQLFINRINYLYNPYVPCNKCVNWLCSNIKCCHGNVLISTWIYALEFAVFLLL